MPFGDILSSIPRVGVVVKVFGHDVELNWVTLAGTAAALFTVSRLLKWFRGLKTVNYCPGITCPFEPLNLPGAAIPTSWWNPGVDFPWRRRFDLYKKYNSEMVSVVPWLSGDPSIYTNNIDIARQIVSGGHRSSWIKPDSSTRSLLFWGMNIVSADSETWRRHRRIMGPAFNPETYAFVWEQTRQLYHEMISEEGWTDKNVIDVPILQKFTFRLALLVISRCGFGFPFTWSSATASEDGKMDVQEALHIYCEHTLLPLITPPWAYNLPFSWMQRFATALKTLRTFMEKQVAERREEIRAELADGNPKQGKKDVFSMLVKANEMEGKEKLQLDDGELIGNIFIVLFAGHETTASTLAITLAMLALHQDLQQEVFDQIIQVAGTEHDPDFKTFEKLTKVAAAFHEGLRLLPVGSLMIRESTEDTFLTVPNPPGEEGSTSMPLPKGTRVIVDMIGVQYNPRYFEEPDEYRPSRWYGKENEAEAVTAFSIGPRACIGRKFATAEAVCFLSLLLRDWKVEPLLKDGESRKEWREKVLQAKLILTLNLAEVPLRFVRRGKAEAV